MSGQDRRVRAGRIHQLQQAEPRDERTENPFQFFLHPIQSDAPAIGKVPTQSKLESSFSGNGRVPDRPNAVTTPGGVLILWSAAVSKTSRSASEFRLTSKWLVFGDHWRACLLRLTLRAQPRSKKSSGLTTGACVALRGW
jgi:hypothetical protein